jgi:hypothetical protein
MGGIFEIPSSGGRWFQGVNTKFHKDLFRHSKADLGEINSQIQDMDNKILVNCGKVHVLCIYDMHACE